jgi:hypothetical protein
MHRVHTVTIKIQAIGLKEFRAIMGLLEFSFLDNSYTWKKVEAVQEKQN